MPIPVWTGSRGSPQATQVAEGRGKKKRGTAVARTAPAASAARACSSICSGSIIACIGVSASAKRDCAQNPQSSAQPPDFALTSEHMSVESPKRSLRTSQARSTSAPISS